MIKVARSVRMMRVRIVQVQGGLPHSVFLVVSRSLPTEGSQRSWAACKISSGMFIMKTEPGGGPERTWGRRCLAGTHSWSYYKTFSISRLNQVLGRRGHAPFLSQFRVGGTVHRQACPLHSETWPVQEEGVPGAAGGLQGEACADPRCTCLPF